MDNRNYIITFMERFNYPEEARQVFLSAYDIICNHLTGKCEFESILSIYAENAYCDYDTLLGRIHLLSKNVGIKECVGTTVLYICMARILHNYYNEAGYTEEMWYTIMCDIKYKVMESKECFDIWGISPQSWYFDIFAMKRFAFGKLQFDLGTFGADYEKDGIVLNSESLAVNVHIPKTGTSLDVESKNQSYRMAAEFYKDVFGGGPVIFTCRSWLLFPKNREVLKPSSNILAFMNDYDLVYTREYEDYKEVWRLFGVIYDGDVDKLPQNSSLQKAYVQWIRKGVKTGTAKGVIIYQV